MSPTDTDPTETRCVCPGRWSKIPFTSSSRSTLPQKFTGYTLKAEFSKEYLDKHPFYKVCPFDPYLPTDLCSTDQVSRSVQLRWVDCQAVPCVRLGAHSRTSSGGRCRSRRLPKRFRTKHDKVLGEKNQLDALFWYRGANDDPSTRFTMTTLST
jgi:hypothetical protein